MVGYSHRIAVGPVRNVNIEPGAGSQNQSGEDSPGMWSHDVESV